MYQSTWFDQNIPYWDTFFNTQKGLPGLNYLEIGCFEGKATVWLLKNVLTHKSSRITVIDTFAGSPEFPAFNIDNAQIRPNFNRNTAKFKDKITVLEGESMTHLPSLLTQRFDFIYVDGSHMALDVLRDGVYAFDLLKRQGAIIFDDYGWDMGTGEYTRPHAAIQSMVSIWGGVYGKWVFWADQAVFIKN